MPAISVARSSPAQRRLVLSTEWVDPYVVRITVAGEVDASNAHELREYVLRRAAHCRSLVLDLREVTFFSTAGFSTLRTIGVKSARANVRLTLHGNSAVSRVIDICDAEGMLSSNIA